MDMQRGSAPVRRRSRGGSLQGRQLVALAVSTTPAAMRQDSNRAVTYVLVAASATSRGTGRRGHPARARSTAAEPVRTDASHPSLRAAAATRRASAQGRGLRVPRAPGHRRRRSPLRPATPAGPTPTGRGSDGGRIARAAKPDDSRADLPPGPSQVRTHPAPARQVTSLSPAAGRRRRSGAGRPRAPAIRRCSRATAALTGVRPGRAGPVRSRRPRRPPDPSTRFTSGPVGRMPATVSTSAIAP